MIAFVSDPSYSPAKGDGVGWSLVLLARSLAVPTTLATLLALGRRAGLLDVWAGRLDASVFKLRWLLALSLFGLVALARVFAMS